MLKEFLEKRPDSPFAAGARKQLAELDSISKDKGNSAFQQSDTAKLQPRQKANQQRRNDHAEKISIVQTLRSLFRGLFGSCEWLRAVCRADDGNIPITVQPNQDVGAAFPATMGTDPNNKYSPEGGLLKLTVSLSVTANGYSFLPPTGVPGRCSTIWQCSGGTTAGSTTQTWQGACATNSDSWSDVLFSGLLTVTSSGGGGGGPATPTTFNASWPTSASMSTPWGGKHRDDPQGHWPPAITNQEHVAETSDSGGLFLPPALCTTGGTGFATYLDTTLPYKILTLKLPTQWVGQPNPATVGTVTFTVPAGVAIYHCGSGSLRSAGARWSVAGAFSYRQPDSSTRPLPS